jgi:hypothetical protein
MSIKTRLARLEKEMSPNDPLSEGWAYARLLRDIGLVPKDIDLEPLAKSCAEQGLSVSKLIEEIWSQNDGVPLPPGAREDE